MKIEIVSANMEDRETLAKIRVASMRDSLEALGRFDPETAKLRFTASFDAENTWKILHNGKLAGFYVLTKMVDHSQLNHFYIHPDHQGCDIGAEVIATIINIAKSSALPLRLGALKGSRSNDFYRKHGFTFLRAEQWDNYYEMVF